MPKLRIHVSDAPPETALAVYLRDHLAGAAGGLALARRLHGNNPGTPYAGVLADLAREIAEDEATLRRLMSHAGVSPSQPKRFVALAGERAARFKLNGQLLGYSSLARVIELETLAGGVQAKQHLWRSLATVDAVAAAVLPPDVDLAELQDRAESQLERIRELHAAAAEEAFAGAADRP